MTESLDPWTEAREVDQRVRLAAFAFLAEQARLRGADQLLPWPVLSDGFPCAGQRVPLVAPQGFFKPAVLPEMPLSIRTAPHVEGKEPPYEDEIGYGGLIRYRYRGTDMRHRENAGLRLAMHQQVPLVYFFGIVEGQYLPAWPVYVIRDDPTSLTFEIAVDLPEEIARSGVDLVADAEDQGRREYVTRLVQQRLHQVGFRIRVLRAYQERCAICRLRHSELLDAAHILPDGHPRGEPLVSNGLALCKLHHAAFDRNFLGIRPDYSVEIRQDLLVEHDGPMLQHGLREFHGRELLALPRVRELRPNREFLAERYELFRRAD